MGARAATEPAISGLDVDQAEHSRLSSVYRQFSLVLPHSETAPECDIATTRIYSDHELFQPNQQHTQYAVSEPHTPLTRYLQQQPTMTATTQPEQHVYHTL
uniref:Uncharacterized protein n=1 Tax=Bactrocera dorsalis TaxID=27457 RepID=A0A034VUZ7_BACDO